MPHKTRFYAMKKPSHWLWRTKFTREQVLQRLEDGSITEDWLICPLGAASEAIPLANFAADADGLSPEEISAIMAIMLYFQEGDRIQVLTAAELAAGFTAYDADRNDIVDQAEFSDRAPLREASIPEEGSVLVTMLEDVDPWMAIVEQVDADGDAALARTELVHYFEENAGEDGIWDFSGPGDDADEGSMSGPPPIRPRA